MGLSVNKQKSALPKIVAVIVGIFIFVGILNLFQGQIKNSFYFIFSPAQNIFWRAGDSASFFMANFFNGKNLSIENESLKSDNLRLLQQIASFKAINGQTQAALNVSAVCQPDDFNLVFANIIGLDIQNDTATIDRGTADGLSEGMPVINDRKILVGKIYEANKNFSEVQLVTNKNSIVDVKIQNSDENADFIFGALKGGGRLSAYLDLIPINEKISENDILASSALEGTFPKDLIIGKIKSVKKDDLKPFQSASVELFFDIKTSENLFVITNYLQQE